MDEPEEQIGGKMGEGCGKPSGVMAVLLFMHLKKFFIICLSGHFTKES